MKMLNADRRVHFFVLFVGAVASATAFQDLTDVDQAKTDRITKLVDKAGNQFKAADFEASGKTIRSAQRAIISLSKAKNEAALRAIKNDYDRLAKAISLLEAKSESFDPLPTFDELLAGNLKSAATDADADSQSDDDETGSDDAGMDAVGDDSELAMISFTRQVAPIIIEHCGKCHIEEDRGKYDASNYNSLKKGARKGLAVKPKDPEKSRLFKLIETGAMPPKSSVPAAQIAILKTWIEQGASFDGDAKSKKQRLTEFVTPGGEDVEADEASNSHGSGTKQ